MPELLPPPPLEPMRVWTLDGLAPRFRAKVERLLATVTRERVYESLRTAERQRWLYGFGRTWQWPGARNQLATVTKVGDPLTGLHFYGLAVDVVENDASPWLADQEFWRMLGESGEREGLIWGGRWKQVDLPHLQWALPPRWGTRGTPNEALRALYRQGGLDAVWAMVGAL